MKNVYKRINRGLVLVGALLVGFVIYVISDTMQFKKTKPLLKDMAAAYMQDLCELNVTPEQYRSLEDLSKQPDYVKSLQESLTRLLDENWKTVESAASQSFYYYGMNRSEVEGSYNSYLKDIEDVYGYITKMTADVNNAECSVTKCGVNTARVVMSFDCEIQYVGDPCWFSPAYPNTMQDVANGNMQMYTDPAIEEGASADVRKRSSDLMSTTISVSYEYTYQLVDGAWKIIYVDSMGWSSGSTVIISGEGGEA